MSPGYPWSENKKKLDFLFFKLTQKTNKNQNNNNTQNVINGGMKDSDLLGRASA